MSRSQTIDTPIDDFFDNFDSYIRIYFPDSTSSNQETVPSSKQQPQQQLNNRPKQGLSSARGSLGVMFESVEEEEDEEDAVRVMCTSRTECNEDYKCSLKTISSNEKRVHTMNKDEDDSRANQKQQSFKNPKMSLQIENQHEIEINGTCDTRRSNSNIINYTNNSNTNKKWSIEFCNGQLLKEKSYQKKAELKRARANNMTANEYKLIHNSKQNVSLKCIGEPQNQSNENAEKDGHYIIDGVGSVSTSRQQEETYKSGDNTTGTINNSNGDELLMFTSQINLVAANQQISSNISLSNNNNNESKVYVKKETNILSEQCTKLKNNKSDGNINSNNTMSTNLNSNKPSQTEQASPSQFSLSQDITFSQNPHSLNPFFFIKKNRSLTFNLNQEDKVKENSKDKIIQCENSKPSLFKREKSIPEKEVDKKEGVNDPKSRRMQSFEYQLNCQEGVDEQKENQNPNYSQNLKRKVEILQLQFKQKMSKLETNNKLYSRPPSSSIDPPLLISQFPNQKDDYGSSNNEHRSYLNKQLSQDHLQHQQQSDNLFQENSQAQKYSKFSYQNSYHNKLNKTNNNNGKNLLKQSYLQHCSTPFTNLKETPTYHPFNNGSTGITSNSNPHTSYSYHSSHNSSNQFNSSTSGWNSYNSQPSQLSSSSNGTNGIQSSRSNLTNNYTSKISNPSFDLNSPNSHKNLSTKSPTISFSHNNNNNNNNNNNIINNNINNSNTNNLPNSNRSQLQNKYKVLGARKQPTDCSINSCLSTSTNNITTNLSASNNYNSTNNLNSCIANPILACNTNRNSQCTLIQEQVKERVRKQWEITRQNSGLSSHNSSNNNTTNFKALSTNRQMGGQQNNKSQSVECKQTTPQILINRQIKKIY